MIIHVSMRGLGNALALAFSFVVMATPISRAVAQAPVPANFTIVDWAPFGWQERDGAYGLFVTIVQLIDRHRKIESDITITPMARLIRGMEEGVFDFTVTYRDPIILTNVEYLGDIGCLTNNILSMQSRPVSTLEQLEDIRVAYAAESPFVIKLVPLLQSLGIEVHGMLVFKSQVIFNMMQRGRVQAIIVNDAVMEAHKSGLLTNNVDALNFWQNTAPPLMIEELPIAVAASKAKGVHQDAKAIKHIIHSPRFQKELALIYKQYGIKPGISCAK